MRIAEEKKDYFFFFSSKIGIVIGYILYTQLLLPPNDISNLYTKYLVDRLINTTLLIFVIRNR